jgi:hypothetical protein
LAQAGQAHAAMDSVASDSSAVFLVSVLLALQSSLALDIFYIGRSVNFRLVGPCCPTHASASYRPGAFFRAVELKQLADWPAWFIQPKAPKTA